MKFEFNSKFEMTMKRAFYRITINGIEYEYIEHENEKGKVIDSEIYYYGSNREIVDNEEELIKAIKEYLDSIGE